MKRLTTVWAIISILITAEYAALHFAPQLSFALLLQRYFKIRGNLTPEPGRVLSLTMGWLGLTFILLTNPYILRKKWLVIKGFGTLNGWLNFHIFAGLLGPTLIVFHCDFRARGLVGLSFWSMLIVVGSGLVGRYLYVQIIRQENTLATVTKDLSATLEDQRSGASPEISVDEMTRAKVLALTFVGLPGDERMAQLSLVQILLNSVRGDLRLLFSGPQVPVGLPTSSRKTLAGYALARRQIAFLASFRKMLGYWHAFHLPFAFVMYALAAIHVTTALLFASGV